jgi:hypothetical protein
MKHILDSFGALDAILVLILVWHVEIFCILAISTAVFDLRYWVSWQKVILSKWLSFLASDMMGVGLITLNARKFTHDLVLCIAFHQIPPNTYDSSWYCLLFLDNTQQPHILKTYFGLYLSYLLCVAGANVRNQPEIKYSLRHYDKSCNTTFLIVNFFLETFHVLEIKLHHAEERLTLIIHILYFIPSSTASMLVCVICLRSGSDQHIIISLSWFLLMMTNFPNKTWLNCPGTMNA